MRGSLSSFPSNELLEHPQKLNNNVLCICITCTAHQIYPRPRDAPYMHAATHFAYRDPLALPSSLSEPTATDDAYSKTSHRCHHKRFLVTSVRVWHGTSSPSFSAVYSESFRVLRVSVNSCNMHWLTFGVHSLTKLNRPFGMEQQLASSATWSDVAHGSRQLRPMRFKKVPNS